MGTKFGPYIFISYSSKNMAQADAIRDMLEQNALENWMAPYDIPAGAKYAYVIDQAIEECSCVLLLLSKEAQASDHVDREIERAISYKKEIIPVCLDGCALNAGFRYYLGNCQIANITTIDAANPAIQDLIGRLRQLNRTPQDALALYQKLLNHRPEFSKTYAVSPDSMYLMIDLLKKLIALLKEAGYSEQEYTLSVKPSPMGTGDIILSLVCYDLVVSNVPAFWEIIQHLDDFEIYPLVDNKLCFSGVIRKGLHAAKE